LTRFLPRIRPRNLGKLDCHANRLSASLKGFGYSSAESTGARLRAQLLAAWIFISSDGPVMSMLGDPSSNAGAIRINLRMPRLSATTFHADLLCICCLFLALGLGRYHVVRKRQQDAVKASLIVERETLNKLRKRDTRIKWRK